MKRLKLALTKGRLQNKTIELFDKLGYDTSPVTEPSRRLVHSIPNGPVDVVLAKAADVITYVEHGVCDMGVVGKDTILEEGRSFYEMLDLGFGRCRFALAVKKGEDIYSLLRDIRIATKYPKVAKSFFDKKGLNVEIIKIEGSVELAPLLGLADGIVDIVETGATLLENGLEPIEDICTISARLIVNTVSMKLRRREITNLIENFRAVL
ncbi:ATP phosphoribosyltransferase [Oscillospiraceae bacterium OttesenSCG-928-G22]|nr:ATP phosphoribosyltransferase [Oscillospiraceae bacterium OttesenSCG-928-G22]